MLIRRMAKTYLAMFIGLATVGSQSQTFNVIHAFKGGRDGSHSNLAPLVFSGGVVYGTTVQGGNSGCYKNLGCGVIFKVNVTSGVEKVVYAFKDNPDGAVPRAGVLKVGGTLYGTTAGGGTSGTGVVYKWAAGTGEAVLSSMNGAAGASPLGSMARDGAGNLYGTAGTGGIVTGVCQSSGGCGTVFKILASGAKKALHKFAGGPSDGMGPIGLIRDAGGNLYGVTSLGGSNPCNGAGCGIVFEISKAGKYSVLYNFAGGTSDGWLPEGLCLDSVNNILYGTTEFGGANNRGAAFSLDLTTGKESVIYSFGAAGDGFIPSSPMVFDLGGNLWGTTQSGGTNNAGTIFELQLAGGVWSEALLFSLPGGNQGIDPTAGLAYDKATGNFYGTLSLAGPITKNCPFGCGTVFQFHP